MSPTPMMEGVESRPCLRGKHGNPTFGRSTFDPLGAGGRKPSLPPGKARKSDKIKHYCNSLMKGVETVPASGKQRIRPPTTRLAFKILKGEGQGSDQSRPDPDETHVGDPQHCTGPLGLKGCLKFDDLSSHPSGNFRSSCAQLPS